MNPRPFLFAAEFALLLAAIVPTALAEGEGVDVHRRQLLLLPRAQVDGMAARQYGQTRQEAARRGVLNTDAAQVERLRRIATRLIPQSARFNANARAWKWEVNLIQTKTVNASCAPGGKIFFYAGILQTLKLDDDEVAIVMGHEIAHALREHGRERMSEQYLKVAGIGLAATFLNLSSLKADLLSKAVDLTLTLPHSRTHETEADVIGLELAARAGYDPRAGVRVWKKMSAAGGGQPPQFLSTHPSHASRIHDIEAQLPKVMPLYEAAPKPARP